MNSNWTDFEIKRQAGVRNHLTIVDKAFIEYYEDMLYNRKKIRWSHRIAFLLLVTVSVIALATKVTWM